MTDNRTKEPTEAQVEAAAREWYEQANGYETWASASGKHQQVVKVRAARALVAAAGAAPQAESVPTSKYISPHLPSMIRNLWKSDPSENSVRTALKLAGDLIQELIDLRAASAQPLNTVDEAALADKLKHWIFQYNQERITLKTFARAVVEAIGGEGRGE